MYRQAFQYFFRLCYGMLAWVALAFAPSVVAQTVQLREISRTATGAVYEVARVWKQPLGASFALIQKNAGFSVASETSLTSLTEGILIEEAQVKLPNLLTPSIRLIKASYEEVALEAASPKAPFSQEHQVAEIRGIGLMRKQAHGTLIVKWAVADVAQNVLRRYTHLQLEVVFANAAAKTVQKAENPHLKVANSVLATGRWFKVPIAEEGIYKIDQAYLNGLGVAGSIDWAKVQVYGNTGQMLPALNGASRIPDLRPIPIQVVSDGVLVYVPAAKGWRYNASANRWDHWINLFSNENYIFIRTDESAQTTIKTAAAPNLAAPKVLTQTEGRWFLEEDRDNIGSEEGSGLDWLGRTLLSESSLNVIDQSLEGLQSGTVKYRARVVARSDPGIQVAFESQGQVLTQFIAQAVDLNASNDIEATATLVSFSNTGVAGAKQTVTMKVGRAVNEMRVWLDWIEAVYPRSLNTQTNLLRFTTPAGQWGETELVLSGFSSAPTVWDLTDLHKIEALTVFESAGTYRIKLNIAKDIPRELVAFLPSSSEVKKMTGGAAVANQNLHGIQTIPDFVIVTPAVFKTQADDLANYRRKQGLGVEVVDIAQILNEFSGGLMDMRAMRDYFKFLYDKDTADKFRYVLLFGDGHFDYRGILDQLNKNSTSWVSLKNWIPTFQSDESLNSLETYTSDDYFGLLDDNEGLWEWESEGTVDDERLDIGIGRFVVQSVAQAENVIRKIKHYEDPTTFGAWRTRFTFVADDEYAGSRPPESDLHTQNADLIARMLEDFAPDLNLNKIYAISYNSVATVNGRQVPDAKRDLLEAFTSSLIWNYSGHGGSEALADEKLLITSDIEDLENFDTLPILITATCSFGHWDYITKQSGAELMLLNSAGGAAGVFTTVRVVFTTPSADALNPGVNRQLVRHLVSRGEDGLPRRLGDALRLTKNTSAGAQHNNRKFNLLGDPSMRIGLGQKKVVIEKINGQNANQENQNIPIRALEKVTIEGRIDAENNQLATDFNGKVELTVFDAARSVKLRDFQWLSDGQYSVQKDLIYRGQATVRQGRFAMSFIVPKDISFSNRIGRISAYGITGAVDAIGHNKAFVVGGTAQTPLVDTKGPEIRLFLNDSTFVSGGLVNRKPQLLVKLFDDNGLNTVGTGVGHELLLVLDEDEQNAKNLGPYFVGAENSYQRGEIRYDLPEQVEGSHTLRVKAWDVANNSTAASLNYQVVSEQRLAIQNVANYPNPTVGPTRFVFEHNQLPGTTASVQIRIYTLNGRLVRSIESDEILPSGAVTGNQVRYQWDGRDEDGDLMATGIYLYKVRMQVEQETETQVAEQIERLALIR